MGLVLEPQWHVLLPRENTCEYTLVPWYTLGRTSDWHGMVGF